MPRPFLNSLLLLFCSINLAFAQKAPPTLFLDGHALLKNQLTLASNQKDVKNTALQTFLRDADKIIQRGKFYSVMDKKQMPPSGDKHDYMSQAPYWWPDSTKPNGLPYIRKDGERNPELKNITDYDEKNDLINEIETLALAYYFSKNERYAAYAARLLKTWFLDSQTKQNPNLNFGQGIPGITQGRGIGLIETREFYRIIDAAILLQSSKRWSKNDHIALKKWFSDFLTWLIESPIGKDEADELNNHGTYYDVQVIAYALFTDQPDLARQQIEVTKQRIASQLKPDGSQPGELARTLSWGYTNMNLIGFFTIARLAENLPIDLWNFETQDGKGIHKCVDWLLPYLNKEKKWEYKQIKERTYEDTVKLLKMAAKAYANPAYDNLAKSIDSASYEAPIYQLTF